MRCSILPISKRRRQISLRHRVREWNVVKRRWLSSADAPTRCRHADRRRLRRNRFEQHRVCSNLRAVADLERPEIFAPQPTVTFCRASDGALLLSLPFAKRPALVNGAAVSSLSRYANYNPHAVVDHHAGADFRPGCISTPVKKARRLADQTRGQKRLVAVKANAPAGAASARYRPLEISSTSKAAARGRVALLDHPYILFSSSNILMIPPLEKNMNAQEYFLSPSLGLV